MPPSAAVVRTNFTGQCVAACSSDGRSVESCTALCGCMFDHLYGTDLFAMKSLADMSAEQKTRWEGVIDACVPP
jgi:uncharacterized membrane protein